MRLVQKTNSKRHLLYQKKAVTRRSITFVNFINEIHQNIWPFKRSTYELHVVVEDVKYTCFMMKKFNVITHVQKTYMRKAFI